MFTFTAGLGGGTVRRGEEGEKADWSDGDDAEYNRDEMLYGSIELRLRATMPLLSHCRRRRRVEEELRTDIYPEQFQVQY